MTTYHVNCYETVSFTVEVEAQNEDEARELVNQDVNSFEIVEERVLDWEINLVEEIDNVTNEDDDEELTTQEQIDYINSHLTSEDNNCMQTFIPGFHD